MTPLYAVGALVALLSVGGGALYMKGLLVPKSVKDEVIALDGRVAALEAMANSFNSLKTAADALTARVTALEGKAAPDLTAVEADIGDINGRLADIEAALIMPDAPAAAPASV